MPTPLSLRELLAHDPQSHPTAPHRRFLCPLPACLPKSAAPHPQAHRSLSVETATGRWKCHRCGASGLLLEFHEERDRDRPTPFLRNRRVAPLIGNREKIGFDGGNREKIGFDGGNRNTLPVRRPTIVPPPPSASAEPVSTEAVSTEPLHLPGTILPLTGTPGSDYLARRGLPTDLCHRNGVRFSPYFMGGAAVVFPIRDNHGKLVAAQARYLSTRESGLRMRTVGPRRLGLFATLDALADDPKMPITICEAPIDALSLSCCGLPALALCGSSGLPAWLVARLSGRIVFAAFDNDDAGERASDGLADLLRPTPARLFRLKPDPWYKDWNDWLVAEGSDAVRGSLADVLSASLADVVAEVTV